jgi:anti-sigma factor RsiW
MSEQRHLSDETLHALIDDELAPTERTHAEAAIAVDPYLAQRAALFRADKARLAQVYGSLAAQPLPERWIETIESWQRRPRPFSIEAIAGIAAVLMLLVGGGLVYREQQLPHEEPIVEEALAARSDVTPARQAIAVRSPAQAERIAQTLTATLAMHVSAPDLQRMGYRLVGLRVYGNAPGDKGVELLYRHTDNRVFALYLRRPSGPPRFDQYRQGRLRVCIWQDDVIGAVMTGEMSAAEMQRLASLAYTGLES